MTDRDVAVHREPLWRDRANFIIMADMADAIDPNPRKRWEQIWARRVGENRYEICCIPFFVYDLALGDIVACHPAGERQYVIREVVESSGHFTFRIWFGDSAVPGIHLEVEQAMKDLQSEVEWSSTNMLALDAADAERAHIVADYLHEREQRGELEYETGRT